jgi:hypothetical protein
MRGSRRDGGVAAAREAVAEDAVGARDVSADGAGVDAEGLRCFRVREVVLAHEDPHLADARGHARNDGLDVGTDACGLAGGVGGHGIHPATHGGTDLVQVAAESTALAEGVAVGVGDAVADGAVQEALERGLVVRGPGALVPDGHEDGLHDVVCGVAVEETARVVAQRVIVAGVDGGEARLEGRCRGERRGVRHR